jgi:NADH-quinone oxidoreductase subunit E
MSVLGKKVEAEIEHLLKIYPEPAATLLPALHAIQHEHGYITEEAKQAVAEKVGVSLARVYEVVSFYSMFFDKPVGKNLLVVCTNMTCGLMGGESLCKYLSEKLGVKPGETTKDGKFTLIRTAECLADCDHPPMMQVNERYHSSLTREKVDKLLSELK